MYFIKVEIFQRIIHQKYQVDVSHIFLFLKI